MIEAKKTLIQTRKALVEAIRSISGKEPIHPLGLEGADWYLDRQLERARKQHSKASGNHWNQPRHPGSSPTLYTRDQIGGTLDEFKKAAAANNRQGENLRRVPITPEIIDATEEILYQIRLDKIESNA